MWPLLCGRPERMWVMRAWSAAIVSWKGWPLNSLPLSQRTLEPPAGVSELAGDAAGELRGLLGGRIVVGADDELGPGESAVAVDRGQLPDGAVGALEPADEEAVEADQLAGVIDLDVLLGLGLARRLVGSAVAGDQRQPLGARVEPVPAQAAPNAVRGDDDPAPLRAAQLGSDPSRPQAGVGDRERDDPLLDHRRQLIRHLRPPPLPRPHRVDACGLVGRAPVERVAAVVAWKEKRRARLCVVTGLRSIIPQATARWSTCRSACVASKR
jgi:hypothetical protein